VDSVIVHNIIREILGNALDAKLGWRDNMGRIKHKEDYISDKEYTSILSRLYQIAQDLDIPFWLTFGTLLGYARHGRHFKEDNDIDIGTTPRGFDILLQNLDVVTKYGFFIREKNRYTYSENTGQYRGLFIYDKNIQPFHVDISEFVLDETKRWTFRWLIRITPPAKVFHYLNKVLMTSTAFTNREKHIPFKDSKQYTKYKTNSIISKIINIIATADLFFTTKRELGMKIDSLKQVNYYGVDVMIPLPVEQYCAVNYGQNCLIPNARKRHPKGGSDCYRYTKDGIQRCFND